MADISTLIADGIINYLLIASVVAALLTPLVCAIVKVAKIGASVYRHMIWLYTLISIVTLPTIWLHGPKINLKVLPAKSRPAQAITSQVYYNSHAELAQGAPTEIHSPRLLSIETTGIRHADPSRPFPVKAVLTGLWLVGTVFMFIRLLVGWFRLRRICLMANPVPGNSRIGDKYDKRLKILLTSQINCPVYFGVLHPVIMLPRGMYINSTPEEIQMVLNHELAHIERRDCLTNLFQRIIEAVFFFHPLVWYASSQLTQQREQICDNYVIEKGARIMDYTKFLSRIAETGLEKTRLRTVALFEGRLLSRIDLLLDPGYSPKTRLSGGTALISALTLLVCFLALGTVRLEAKSAVQNSSEASQTETATGTAEIDPKIRELGEAVRKRLTTYSDEETLTLEDGQTGRMKVKENITPVAQILITPHILADGTKFDLEGIDAAGKTIGGTKTTSSVIHNAQSMRMGLGKHFSVNGKDIMSKIQLTSTRQDGNSVAVEVKVLFTRIPTLEETDAMLLMQGKDGHLHLNYREISGWIMQHKLRTGYYPKDIKELNRPLPKDVYSPTGEDYRYEGQRTKFILSSCGKDGVYGNDDDEIFIAFDGGARSGQRHELYPLEEDEQDEHQIETLGPSGRRPKGNCTISGKVVSAQTGEPVAHTKVYLFCTETFDAIFIDVAGDGTFVLKDIPTGPFSLRSTNTAGYQDAIYNPDERPGEYPEFSLKNGETRSDIILKAEPAYSITGRVFDENGEPLKDRTLWVWALVESDEPQGDFNRYNIAKQTRISSDGSYLLDGLDNREAYVMAIDLRSQEKDIFYPPCYYPGTVARDEAKKVSFNEKRTAENIDIHLKKKGEFILEGIVTDETTGDAIPKALVTIHHRDMLFDRMTTYTDEKGRYRIESLGTGEFLVHIDAEPWGFVRMRRPVKIEAAARINQLNFTLRPGAKISGKFVDENGNPFEINEQAYGLAYRYGYPNPETMSWSGVNNKYSAKDGRAGHDTFNGGEGDYEEEYMDFPTSGTFIIEGMMPCKTVFRFHPKTPGQTVKDILHKGKSIMETGIETTPGQEIKDITIVIGAP